MDSSFDVAMDGEAPAAGSCNHSTVSSWARKSFFLPEQGLCLYTGAPKRPFYELCAPLIKVSCWCVRSVLIAGSRHSKVVKISELPCMPGLTNSDLLQLTDTLKHGFKSFMHVHSCGILQKQPCRKKQKEAAAALEPAAISSLAHPAFRPP
jgi:hypothetical protein